MRSTSASSKLAGFTLVELLVISPVLVILVAVTVGFFINLTGDALVSRERNSLIHSLQDSLDEVEEDVRLSTKTIYQTGTLPSPQGSNSNYTGTTQFTSNANTLVLERPATTSGPLDPNRQLLYYADSPNSCSPGTSYLYNELVYYRTVYFLDGTNFTKRTLVDFGGRNVCNVSSVNAAGIFQRNSCKTTNLGLCYARDSIIAKNINAVNFQYFAQPDSQVAINPNNSNNPSGVRVTLTGQVEIAGSTISQPLSVRAERNNTN